MKYYSSYHLIDSNIIEQTEGVPFFLKVYYSSATETNIGESLNNNGEISWVIYFTDQLTGAIKKHHTDNYSDAECSTCRKIKNGVLITFYNKVFEEDRYLVETYYPDGRVKILQDFDSDFELVEYRQMIYGDDQALTGEKLFYPDSWTIHSEEIE